MSSKIEKLYSCSKLDSIKLVPSLDSISNDSCFAKQNHNIA
jgi:hypothetical protein